MAKITITLRDKRDGTVRCTVDLDPPIKRDQKEVTAAQSMLAVILNAMSDNSDETELVDVESEE